MRDPARIHRIINKLELLWNKHPDLRLTQLLWILARSNYVFFFVEDDYIEKRIDKFILKDKISDD